MGGRGEMAVDVEDIEFGAWAMERQLYDYIRKILPTGSTILELGSGTTTDLMAEHYTMYSVEHDEKWVDKYNSTYLHVPLCDHKPIKGHRYTNWYDANILREKLKGVKYDLLLIDGPPVSRSGFFKYMDLFDSNAIWIFDDAHRPGERKVINSVASKLKRPWVTYHGNAKTFSVINSPLLLPVPEGIEND
jgi:hypothetical protein